MIWQVTSINQAVAQMRADSNVYHKFRNWEVFYKDDNGTDD